MDRDAPAPGPAAFRRSLSKWPILLGTPLALAAAWMAYSALFVDHAQDLPPALPGERLKLDTPAGAVNVYADGPTTGTPLLLIHSVNAAASAYEVRPLYLRYQAVRRVYALDLPGFGFSERRDQVYTPRVMCDAIHAAAAAIKLREGGPIDMVALSLACEYAARAALERPEDYRTLGFVSPTGFDKVLSGDGPEGSTRGRRLALSLVSQAAWSRALFDLLVSRPSMRLFLWKTWGSRQIDGDLLAYDERTAHQPGAQHAVWSFLAGYLFANDVTRLYRRLKLPVWVGHGTRGDFVDYSHATEFARKGNWTFDVFDTGAFPHFERLAEVVAAYEAFLSGSCAGIGDSRAP